MRFSVHPCIILIDYFFQQNSYPFCVVSDDVKKVLRFATEKHAWHKLIVIP